MPMTSESPLTVMIVDDDPDDCFFHERAIRKSLPHATVVVTNDADEALAYLRSDSEVPNIIMLDINMPRKSGWDFLNEFELLDSDRATSTVVVMLTSSQAPGDVERAEQHPCVSRFAPKPLDNEMFTELLEGLVPD